VRAVGAEGGCMIGRVETRLEDGCIAWRFGEDDCIEAWGWSD